MTGHKVTDLSPLRRLFPFAGFVLLGEFGFEFGVAGEALGVGAVVLFAPVSLFLKVGCDLGVAESAEFDIDLDGIHPEFEYPRGTKRQRSHIFHP